MTTGCWRMGAQPQACQAVERCEEVGRQRAPQQMVDPLGSRARTFSSRPPHHGHRAPPDGAREGRERPPESSPARAVSPTEWRAWVPGPRASWPAGPAPPARHRCKRDLASPDSAGTRGTGPRSWSRARSAAPRAPPTAAGSRLGRRDYVFSPPGAPRPRAAPRHGRRRGAASERRGPPGGWGRPICPGTAAVGRLAGPRVSRCAGLPRARRTRARLGVVTRSSKARGSMSSKTPKKTPVLGTQEEARAGASYWRLRERPIRSHRARPTHKQNATSGAIGRHPGVFCQNVHGRSRGEGGRRKSADFLKNISAPAAKRWPDLDRPLADLWQISGRSLAAKKLSPRPS